MQRRPATLEDVAAKAGVSRQTASRAVNGKREIRPETRDRVLDAAAALGYEPNTFARGLVTHRSSTIGLVVGDITNPFFPDVSRGVLEEAEQHDLVTLVCNLGFGWDTLKPLRALARRAVDGFIVFPALVDEEKIADFAGTYGPLVVVDAPFDYPTISTVRIDWTAGVQAAAAHLAASSSRVAILNAHREHASSERVDLFRGFARAEGLHTADDAVVPDDMTVDGGRRATSNLLAAGVRFDALFAYNDLMAIGALETLAEAGIRVPEDCRVVGCDDIPLAAHLSPPLSSVAVDRYALGTLAMQELHRRVQDPDAPAGRLRVDVSLVERASTTVGAAGR